MRYLKNRYHIAFFKKTVHSFDIITTQKKSPNCVYLIFIDYYRIYNMFIAITYFWELTSDLKWLFLEALLVLCRCSGIIPQQKNAESVKIFNFKVIF